MPMHKAALTSTIALLVVCSSLALGERHARADGAAAHGPKDYGLGATPTARQIAGWDIDASSPDGSGLPPGQGSVSEGKQVYQDNCSACHGGKGEGPMFKLAGGIGSLASNHPVQTVGSYWPYATTVWDYINRAMPITSPHTLTHDQIYAVTAYVLHLNQIVPEDAIMSASTLAKVKMPNVDKFTTEDPRPDVHNIACMKECLDLHLKAPGKLPK